MIALKKSRSAFSLVELVVVVVILGIIAAIAIPRMSRGAAGATDAGLASDLAVLRSAIALYSAEHNGNFPAASDIADQLTLYSDINGNTNASRTSTFLYGPYMQTIPAVKVGAKRGQNGIAAADGATVGWIYTAATGAIRANTTTEADAAGTLYSAY